MPASRGEILAWGLYDFANSPFSTTITTVVFNVYFVQVVVGEQGAWGLPASSLWGYLVAASTLVMGLCSPFLGAAADLAAAKKRFLLVFTAAGALATAGLCLTREGTVATACVLFFMANLAFAGAFSFYSAFLPELVQPERFGRISGFGWALGYIGGGLCLALNLLMIQRPQWLGIPPGEHLPVRLSFLVVGLWWAIFSLPLFLFLKERAVPSGGGDLLRHAVQRTIHTLREVRRYPDLVRFLIAYLLYNDGIETVIVMASVFAAEELGMGTGQIISCFLLIQGVAFLGSLLFGRLADWVGNKPAVLGTLAVWIAVVVWAVFMRSPGQFWAAGVVIGLVLGGSQSASRSLFALFTPKENSAEFFGFLSLSGKVVATLGPLTFALARQALGSVRWAIGVLVLFFMAGAALLSQVDEERGARQAALPVTA